MTKTKVAFPVGLRCTNVRWMTNEEAESEGWLYVSNPTAVLEFNDGSIIYASCDPEGNDAGALFAKTSNGELAYIVPLEEIN